MACSNKVFIICLQDFCGRKQIRIFEPWSAKKYIFVALTANLDLERNMCMLGLMSVFIWRIRIVIDIILERIDKCLRQEKKKFLIKNNMCFSLFQFDLFGPGTVDRRVLLLSKKLQLESFPLPRSPPPRKISLLISSFYSNIMIPPLPLTLIIIDIWLFWFLFDVQEKNTINTCEVFNTLWFYCI